VIAQGVMLAGAETRVRDREVFFAESRMAQFLGQRTLLVDIQGGPALIADALSVAASRLERDLLVFIDVGGDVLGQGSEPGLTSPLCDAVMLAAAARLGAAGHPVLAGIFGIGCDAELTPEEVLSRIAEVADAGGLCGVRGLTAPVVDRLEGAIRLVPTEASAQAVRAFRGASGLVAIRGGSKTLPLSPIAALTVYLDVEVTLRTSARLGRAVDDAASLEAANDALHRLGVRTELDFERESSGPSRC
jgi:hypothetical protein